MGSDSDLDIMNEAAKALSEFGVPYEIDITSAHRSPVRTSEYSRGLKSRGVKVVIAGAGGAAHLAGVIAAETTLPVSANYFERNVGSKSEATFHITQVGLTGWR